jgi:hypothetical protein
MPLLRTFLLLVGYAVISLSLLSAADTVTFASLLGDMVDRDRMARFPNPTFVTGQASSYDRASVSPDKPGWFANHDYDQCIRTETIEGRTEYVIMDVDGPGAITRFWKAGSDDKNHVRIYLDGSQTPVINEVADAWLGGDLWIKGPLAAVTARGINLYAPIPYAKHCKVTLDHLQADWYNIEYRTYPAGTSVTSFTRADFDAAAALFDRVSHQLVGLGDDVPSTLRQIPGQIKSLAKGQSLTVTIDGPAAIRELCMKITGSDQVQALRSTVLTIECDGEHTVWCPVGDFYGSGVGLNPYHDWYNAVNGDGALRCWWIMPFKKSAVICVTNLGKRPVEVALNPIQVSPWTFDDRSMYFHSTWRQQYPLMTKHAEGTCDWNFVTITGQGVYLGDALAIHNGSGGWWGEGDEKISVDGEAFPSHFGTGSEDYYGYAWGDPHFFEAPFHAQPRAQGNNNVGHTTDTRVRDLDGITFNRSLNVDLEVWHWDSTIMAYAAATYWYAKPGATSNRTPMTDEAAHQVPPGSKPGVAEAETMDIKTRPTSGTLDIQSAPRWSMGGQLWWHDATPGSRLELFLPVDEDGHYKLGCVITTAPDYGIMQMSLDGEKLGNPIDGYSAGVAVRTIDLGVHQLKAGDHVLTIEITGSNPAAEKRHMVGLDCFTYLPAP